MRNLVQISLALLIGGLLSACQADSDLDDKIERSHRENPAQSGKNGNASDPAAKSNEDDDD